MAFSFYLDHSGRSYSNDEYSSFGKRPLTIAAMNAELPPFKNGEHNSESASTLDRDITPLKRKSEISALAQYPSVPEGRILTLIINALCNLPTLSHKYRINIA